MTAEILKQIEREQGRGRAKYGKGPDDTDHDDSHYLQDWIHFIGKHNLDAALRIEMNEFRERMIKIAGLAVSAIEAFDRVHGVQ